MNRLISVMLALIGLALVGCTNTQAPANIALPLDDSQPTFIFFYTNN